MILAELGDHNDRAGRLRIVLDYYLDLGRGLSEGAGELAIWPCPVCGEVSFLARFGEGVAGCVEEGCEEVPSSMGVLELIAYLDEGLEPGDVRGAGERSDEILEAARSLQQERRGEKARRRRRAREEKSRANRAAEVSGEGGEEAEERLF